ncbi:MAG: hypothetical protein KGV51_01020 [Moraxellaceae bacterium]|nr:hypothetical protein [Moraxellaceae bacterium]
MSKVIFERNKTNTVSKTFVAPATVTGYDLLANQPIIDESDSPTHGMVTDIKCGDYITFEKLLFADDYDIACGNDISSEGVIASTPLRDECGEPIKLTACHNILDIAIKGNFRAIYHGDGRSEAIVTTE